MPGEMFFLDGRHREVDLATLAKCNHSITSTGTFSWWVGYLGTGQTVRFGGWPRPGSALAQMVAVNDFFPPDWTVVQ